ncbi:MAG: N-(5'-phosphoribosyl)anthranilate isomerase [Roseovarius sp.]
MRHAVPSITPESWMADLFGSKAARDGRVLRRCLRDIERYVGRDRLMQELRRRGYHAVENAGQLVIFCNQEPIRRVL